MGKGKKNANKKKPPDRKVEEEGGGLLAVDPARVRFQHSRIRPFFSGCGRSVEETLESIRRKEISPSELPAIQVIVGPTTEDGPNYFSLNNRRLWVLKRCREEGLLVDNKVFVRVRQPKSNAEAARYSIDNCALEAKIMPSKVKGADDELTSQKEFDSGTTSLPNEQKNEIQLEGKEDFGTKTSDIHSNECEGSDDEPSESDSDEGIQSTNRFSALF